MIVTIKATFIDAPAGREEKKYFVGDVVDMSKNDYERIHSQNKDLLLQGKHDLGTGICYPCIRKKTKR